MDNLPYSAMLAFEQALQAGSRRRLLRRITLQPIDLPTLELATTTEGYGAAVDRGLQTIAVDAIVGTVTENQRFDHAFLPLYHNMQQRWARIYAVAESGYSLPPIHVMLRDGRYYVIDGHHRVSVARQLGQHFIEAYVIEAYVVENNAWPTAD